MAAGEIRLQGEGIFVTRFGFLEQAGGPQRVAMESDGIR
jgi:hypothetical protein